jgi:predicted nucleotidyltransferase
METTKNEMDIHSKNFFLKLGNYLDTQIYYFGSIQRDDYFPGKSDIDVDLFTYNEPSTIIKLQNFLGLEKYKFKKFVYKLHKTNKIVYGHKVKYGDPDNNFFTEISIYNEKDKDAVLLEHNSKAILPFYVLWLLIILKTFYYNLGILSEEIYNYFKIIIMDLMVEGEDTEFVTTEIPEHKPDIK